jgi:hypothetical protein
MTPTFHAWAARGSRPACSATACRAARTGRSTTRTP